MCDRSARRFAQDDAFSEGIEKHPAGCKEHEKIEKVTATRDDKGKVGVCIECGDLEEGTTLPFVIPSS
jgi:hypothetical protein